MSKIIEKLKDFNDVKVYEVVLMEDLEQLTIMAESIVACGKDRFTYEVYKNEITAYMIEMSMPYNRYLALMQNLRSELSKKNKYWIDKNRYYELKYFCLQYPLWKRAYEMKEIEEAALKADPYLASYILKAVTEGLSFNYLKSRLEIPCGRDMYYDRYRRFFWLLNRSRK